METHSRRLLTIVTESILERHLLAELEALGARGYTVSDARGKGSRGPRQSDWTQGGNIRVEVVCEPELAERIAERLRTRFYADYAMILFMHDVDVLRRDKF